jgi:hypothetical protein
MSWVCERPLKSAKRYVARSRTMDSSKRRKTNHNDDGNQDGDNYDTSGMSSREFSSEALQFLFEPKMSSLFLGFCDFQELLALRSMTKTLKGFADQECTNRALKALPLCSEAAMVGRISEGDEINTNIQVRLGWKDADHYSREALLNKTLYLAEGGDNIKASFQVKFDKSLKQKAKDTLRRIGHFDTEDLDDDGTNDGLEGSKQYIQRPYAGYTKYPLTYRDQEPHGWGGAIIYEESISLKKAMKLVQMMLWSLRETESLGNSPTTDKPRGELRTEFSVLVQHLKSLFMLASASSIRHGYLAYDRRNPFPSRGRSGALQFRSAGQEIEVIYTSVSFC